MIKAWCQIIIGLLLWGVAISVGITWIAFCFGTVIIGVLLLFFAPHILLLPPVFISAFANGFLLVGLANIKRSERDKNIIEGEAEWVRTEDDEESTARRLEDKDEDNKS